MIGMNWLQTARNAFIKSNYVIQGNSFIIIHHLIFWFQRTRSYFCDRRGNVICQSGWEKSQENENPLHPCSVPICRDGCNNGECKAPNYCTCDIGWTGLDCSTCLEKPGCQHGSCNEAFECNCDPEWFGSHCQTRKHNYNFHKQWVLLSKNGKINKLCKLRKDSAKKLKKRHYRNTNF